MVVWQVVRRWSLRRFELVDFTFHVCLAASCAPPPIVHVFFDCQLNVECRSYVVYGCQLHSRVRDEHGSGTKVYDRYPLVVSPYTFTTYKQESTATCHLSTTTTTIVSTATYLVVSPWCPRFCCQKQK